MPARPRVELLVPDLAVLDAALEGREALVQALGGLEVAEGWLDFPQALPVVRAGVAADPSSTRWGTRFFLLEEPRTLVGWGGFKGPPTGGVVELGYAVAPGLRGQGVASAAVGELLREAFAVREVTAVIAHTLAEPGPSVRVLEKAGFRLDGHVDDEEAGKAWRFRLGRRAG